MKYFLRKQKNELSFEKNSLIETETLTSNTFYRFTMQTHKFPGYWPTADSPQGSGVTLPAICRTHASRVPAFRLHTAAPLCGCNRAIQCLPEDFLSAPGAYLLRLSTPPWQVHHDSYWFNTHPRSFEPLASWPLPLRL